MYICDRCKAVFEDPGHVGEVHYELDDKAIEYFAVCPECGSFWFDEAELCNECAEWIPAEDMYDCNYCKECAGKLRLTEE